MTTRGVALALDDITHRFGHTVAVDGVSLRVEPGEIVALLAAVVVPFVAVGLLPAWRTATLDPDRALRGTP